MFKVKHKVFGKKSNTKGETFKNEADFIKACNDFQSWISSLRVESVDDLAEALTCTYDFWFNEINKNCLVQVEGVLYLLELEEIKEYICDVIYIDMSLNHNTRGERTHEDIVLALCHYDVDFYQSDFEDEVTPHEVTDMFMQLDVKEFYTCNEVYTESHINNLGKYELKVTGANKLKVTINDGKAVITVNK